VIDERFGVRDREGVDIEILGGTSGVNGGGFVYTNLDTLAVGVVLKLPKLAAQKLRPEEIIANLKAHPGIAPLVEGGEIKEYSAHVIPEAGLAMMPKMTGDGMLVAGDAAAMCLAAGIWLEGVNFAMASGMYAAEAAAEALTGGDTSAAGLAGYERRLNDTFVLRDHRKLRRAPSLVLSDRVQHLYPHMIANTVERMFQVDNPTPSPGCGGSSTRSADAPVSSSGTSRVTPSTVCGASDDRALARAVVRGPDRHDAIRRPRTRPHHRRRRDLRRLLDTGLRGRLPGQPLRADERRGHPLQLRTVLRVRHLLPRVQRGRCDHLDLSRGRPRRRLQAHLTERMSTS
jgi:hypothetical protein